MVSKVEFNQEDREWFHKICVTASGSSPADWEVDEEGEEPRTHVEQATDLLEAVLGMYPTNVKGGIDAEFNKLVMKKECQCVQTGRRTSTCTGFCK